MRYGTQQTTGAAPRQHTTLALKITGIVFWGLIVTGFSLAYFVLDKFEQDTLERVEMLADNAALTMQQHTFTDPGLSVGLITEKLRELSGHEQVAGLQLRYDDNLLTVGEAGQGFEVVRSIAQPSGGKGHELKIYFTGVDSALTRQRKDLLMTMGVVFLLFGFVLQWILQRVLTKPFYSMVGTAQAISNGAASVRFNQSRQDEFGYLAKFINQSLDYLTEQKEALFHEKEMAEVTLHSIGDAVVTTDADGTVQYLNPMAEHLVGVTLVQAQGRPIGEVLRIHDAVNRKPVGNPVMHCLEQGDVVDVGKQNLLLRHDGREVVISESAAPIRDRNGHVIGAIMVFQDMTKTRQLAQQLTFQAMHDALTGLYNRREFENQLQAVLDSARDEGTHHALCYMDLDQFKIVNDTCGHIAGDELLRQLCKQLQYKVRGTDILARLGGDELGVLLTHCDLQEAEVIAEGLRQTVKDFRFAWEGHSFDIRVSIGLVEINAQSENITALMSLADMACYAAKDKGRNRVHVYRHGDRELNQRHGEMRWVSRINRSMEDEQFEIYYQPIVPVSGGGDGRLHYEILLRLRDNEDGVVAPMAFIPAAERYNIMPSLDRWVIRKTLDMLAENKVGAEQCVVGINLSGHTLGSRTTLDFITEQLQRTGVDPSCLCFEITETAAVANLSKAAQFIHTLRELGCSFALDDFGSGLSSFGYLKDMKVDYLKIDGSFVRDIVDDPIHRAMVEAIVHVGHVMEIETIAEYVENEATLQGLRRLGVDYVQGYHLGRPRPMSQWKPYRPDSGALLWH